MSRRPSDFSVFQRTLKNQKVWCVYFRDKDGERLNPIFVSKLKSLLYKGKHGYEPIKDRTECIRICEKSLNNEKTTEYIFRKTKPSSPNFIEMVRMIEDYDNSPYIKGRLKEGNPVLRHTIQCNINSFNTHIVPLIPKDLTLKDIDNSNGSVLTEIRDKVIELDISPSIKNKGLQSMRDTLKYCSQRSMLKFDYKDRLKNSNVNEITGGNSPLDVDEINKVNEYYFTHTQKGTWERYKYLITLLSSTTGMRPCEVMGLKKNDIVKIDKDNDCGIIYLNHDINVDNNYSSRKNHRCVYLSTFIPLVEEMIDFCDSNPKKSEWVFWDRNHPENHITKDQFDNIPKSSFSEIGIKVGDRKLSFYSLRKTSGTIIGNNNKYRHHKSSSLLGHSNVLVTEQHYITNTPESSIENFNEIREHIKLPC